ncbi:MAG: DUF2945 domain-containing protein [Pseudomonadota bacterium]
MAISVGDEVTWSWGEGTASGAVTAIHEERVERTLKGSTVVRNGSPDDPALEIEQEDGDEVLKLASEVDPS